MFPFLLPMWESDATARAAVEQSVASSVTDVGTGAMMAGVDASFDAATRDPMADYDMSVGGMYGRVFQVSLESGSFTPADSASVNVGAGAGWVTSPLTRVSLSTQGYMATQLGTRANDELAARDPWLYGNRLQYTVGGGPGLSVVLSRRANTYLSGGYEQSGALSGDDPQAVGIDTHTGRAGLGVGFNLSDVDTLTPSVRYEYTHFYHALANVTVTPDDIAIERAPADVHAGTALLSLSHEFGRNVSGQIGGGVTVANPMPIMQSDTLVVAPAARVGLAYVTKRYRLETGYAYEYTSLGPTLGFGQQHGADARLGFRPVRGGRFRDFFITGVGRVAVGSLPVGLNPRIPTQPGEEPLPPDTAANTFLAVAGAALEFPLARGVVLLGGFDLEYQRGTFDPAPPGSSASSSLRTIWTVGIAGTLSTDPESTLRRDPDTEYDDRRRSEMIRGMPSGRWVSPQIRANAYEQDAPRDEDAEAAPAAAAPPAAPPAPAPAPAPAPEQPAPPPGPETAPSAPADAAAPPPATAPEQPAPPPAAPPPAPAPTPPPQAP